VEEICRAGFFEFWEKKYGHANEKNSFCFSTSLIPPAYGIVYCFIARQAQVASSLSRPVSRFFHFFSQCHTCDSTLFMAQMIEKMCLRKEIF